jgi:hypothetical protein
VLCGVFLVTFAWAGFDLYKERREAGAGERGTAVGIFPQPNNFPRR